MFFFRFINLFNSLPTVYKRYRYNPAMIDLKIVFLGLQVQQLLQLVTQAKEAAAAAAGSSGSCSESFLSWFWVDTNGYNSDIYDDLAGTGDARKVESHLSQVHKNLCQIFKVYLCSVSASSTRIVSVQDFIVI